MWELVQSSVIEYLTENVKKKKLTAVVCGFVSYFRNDVMDVCNKCKSIVYIRPQIQKLATKHKVPIVCVNCADKKEVAVATLEVLDRIKAKLGEKGDGHK